MKKILLSMVAAVAMLATSCVTDATNDLSVGGESIVSFSVESPKLDSRYGEGDEVSKLYYAVYKDDQLLPAISVLPGTNAEAVSLVNGGAKVNLTLAQGIVYNIIFWAASEEAISNGLYSFDWNNKTMSIDPTKLVASDESLDAFYKAIETETVADGQSYGVALKRPFAQLNVATGDTNKAANAGLTVAETYIMTQGYTTLNMGDGTVDGLTQLTYATANKATGTIDVNSKTYDLLAVAYVLVNDMETLNVTFGYTETVGGATVKEIEVPMTPLKRNYRTNLVGNILTTDSNFDVNIEANPDGTENIEIKTVGSAQGLQDAINALNNPSTGSEGETVTIQLTDDINLNDLVASLSSRATVNPSLTIKNGKELTLDLNGYTLSGTDNGTAHYALITNQGNLKVVGPGNIQLTATTDRDWNAYSSVISNTVGGNLVVEGGAVIEHLGGTDMAYGIDNLTNGKGTSAIVTVKDATVKSTYRPIRQFLNGVEATNELYVLAGAHIESTGGNKAAIWMQDPSTAANSGKLVVEAGAHIKNNVYLDVTEGSTEWPVVVEVNASSLENGATVISENVPKQYLVVEENGVWTVMTKEPGCVYSAEELAETINSATEDIAVKFANDLEGIVTVNQKRGIHVTIDGDGKNYKGGLHIFGNGGMNDRWMTIKNIHFDGTGLNGDQGCIYTTGNVNGVNSYACNVTIEDCTFTGAGIAAIRQNVGGERNWTVKRCTVAEGMHSFLQVSNTNESLVVENCEVYSKNGANLNYTANASFTDCNFDVQGYAVRVGVNGSNSTETKTFNFTDCTLKSANDDGDAVVIIRQDAQQATLNFVNTELIGEPMISGNTANTKITGIALPQQNNEIWYTATALVEAHYYADGRFGAGFVSNVWDETTGKGVITFDGDVTKIGINAFYGREHLTSISLPNSVVSIDEDAFDYCPNLTTVEFNNNLKVIGEGAFGACGKLTNVVLPESLTTIGNSAFNSCTSLKSITIPAGVTSIGSYAFNGIKEIKVYCKPTTPPTVGSTPFNQWWAEIYVPTASLADYQSAWGSVVDNIYDGNF